MDIEGAAFHTIVSMGFNESAAREALHRRGGNLDRAIESLLSSHDETNSNPTFGTNTTIHNNDGSQSSVTNNTHFHNNKIVHSEISQYTFPNGRSACTCIALSGATLGLKELAQNASNAIFSREIINAELIQDAVIAGVGMYENRPITADGVEHMSVEEVLHNLPQYSADLQLIGGVRQGIVSKNVIDEEMGIRSIITACRTDQNANCNKWMAIVMTKTPETVALFIPPPTVKDGSDNESFKKFVLLDSHSRPQFMTVPGGSYAMICNSVDDLTKLLENLFPVTDLGSDVGELMSMMYNSFDMYAFQLKS